MPAGSRIGAKVHWRASDHTSRQSYRPVAPCRCLETSRHPKSTAVITAPVTSLFPRARDTRCERNRGALCATTVLRYPRPSDSFLRPGAEKNSSLCGQFFQRSSICNGSDISSGPDQVGGENKKQRPGPGNQKLLSRKQALFDQRISPPIVNTPGKVQFGKGITRSRAPGQTRSFLDFILQGRPLAAAGCCRATTFSAVRPQATVSKKNSMVCRSRSSRPNRLSAVFFSLGFEYPFRRARSRRCRTLPPRYRFSSIRVTCAPE